MKTADDSISEYKEQILSVINNLIDDWDDDYEDPEDSYYFVRDIDSIT